jgi:hypothetical protein
MIDDEDYELVSQYRWCARKNHNAWYAQTHLYRCGKRTTVSMHQIIINAQPKQLIDHINRDGLDNRRENLRACSPSQNQQNSYSRRGTSIYKGVRKCSDCDDGE